MQTGTGGRTARRRGLPVIQRTEHGDAGHHDDLAMFGGRDKAQHRNLDSFKLSARLSRGPEASGNRSGVSESVLHLGGRHCHCRLQVRNAASCSRYDNAGGCALKMPLGDDNSGC
jgi:hypothetical protein